MMPQIDTMAKPFLPVTWQFHKVEDLMMHTLACNLHPAMINTDKSADTLVLLVGMQFN